jgi:hypothetical protein
VKAKLAEAEAIEAKVREAFDRHKLPLAAFQCDIPTGVAIILASMDRSNAERRAAESALAAERAKAERLREALAYCVEQMKLNPPKAPTLVCYRAEFNEAIKDAEAALAEPAPEPRAAPSAGGEHETA